MSTRKIYEKTTISEGRFNVTFSNDGEKIKYHPFDEIIRNPERKKMKCVHTGCDEIVTAKTGVCSKHGKNEFGLRRKKHLVDWVGKLKIGEDSYTPAHSKMIESLISWMSVRDKKRRIVIMDSFIKDSLKRIVNLPDSTTIQMNLEGKTKEGMHPDDVIKIIIDILNSHFPSNAFSDEFITGVRYQRKEMPKMPIRIGIALMLSGLACEQINRGDIWLCKTNSKYGESRYGNIYMPLAYYLIRRYTKATPKQARTCLKG